MSISRLQFRETAEAVLELLDGAVTDFDDDTLQSAQRIVAAHRQVLDECAAMLAGEIGRRSRLELGYAGLAQRSGFRTPEAMVQSLTGATRSEASSLVHVGAIMAETDAAAALQQDPSTATTVEEPWGACLARAVSGKLLSIAAADAIRVGLGEISENVTAEMLAAAAETLVTSSAQPGGASVELLRRLARQHRDELDADGLVEREGRQREAQYLKTWKRADGMYGGSLLLDAENGAYLTSVIDEITNPRRGGPRFVGEEDLARVDTLIADTRSNERIALESLIQLVRIGSEADPGTVFGSRRPAVRVVVTAESLARRSEGNGNGMIELSGDALSLASVGRHICDAGTVKVLLDETGQVLDVGREQRLFTKRQRVGLAVRDGGCLWTGCERPPSWTEAHHIDEWAEHQGLTNIADGVLLCRHHHMLLHNNHWRIIRDGDTYWLRPPATEDPNQTLRPMPSKSPIQRKLVS